MRKMIFTVTAIALLPIAANAMPHGRPGLWTISTKMDASAMPQMTPQMMEMMKQRGIKLPGMDGAPIVTQMCMTDQDVKEGAAAMQRLRQQHEVNCTPRILGETSNSVSTEVTCHGTMEGVGRSQISWRGDTHYEGTYNFTGSMHGRSTSMGSHYVGEFVKSDCGSVKPYSAKDFANRIPAHSPPPPH